MYKIIHKIHTMEKYMNSWQAIIVHDLMLKIINYEHVFLEQCVRSLNPLTYTYYHQRCTNIHIWIQAKETIPLYHIISPPHQAFTKFPICESPHAKIINVRAPQILAKNPRKMSCMHEYFSKNVSLCSTKYDERFKNNIKQSPSYIEIIHL